jgi:hypothetical protein
MMGHWGYSILITSKIVAHPEHPIKSIDNGYKIFGFISTSRSIDHQRTLNTHLTVMGQDGVREVVTEFCYI